MPKEQWRDRAVIGYASNKQESSGVKPVLSQASLRRLAVSTADEFIKDGTLQEALDRRIRLQTESQSSDAALILRSYLTDELAPVLDRLGFRYRIVENPVNRIAPFLIAERHEGASFPTALLYGHCDVTRGNPESWRDGLNPWRLTIEGDCWYGRGTADNKGQHSINLAALEAVLRIREGKLGCNIKWLFETGEEIGSPGLREVCQQEVVALRADVFLASDGPRLSADQPTLFLGARGNAIFDLHIKLRDGSLHSGNWGGIKRNAATILTHALSCLVDARGRIQVKGLKPTSIPEDIRQALRSLELDERHLGEPPDSNWGEDGMSAAERLLGWNALEILAFSAGDIQRTVNAIPPDAIARCQLRFVVGTPWQTLEASLRRHLDDHGFGDVAVRVNRCTPATRGSPDDAWVKWALTSMRTTLPADVVVLPNLGGTLPNDIFVETLRVPTLWIPHSYPRCRQHTSDEHLLASVASEGLQLMAGIFWDLGESSPHRSAAERSKR